MRFRQLVVSVLILAVAAFVATRLWRPAVSPQAASISSPTTQSFLVIFGIGDKTDTNWDGSIAATGGTILKLDGWRFTGTDAITGTASWKMLARTAPPPPSATTGPMEENGLIVTIAASSTPVTLDIKTGHGNFSFTSQGLPFGASKSFLNGSALVAQTGAPLQLTASNEDEDFPAMAQAGDDVYLTYTQFVHGDRTQARRLNTPTTITDFTSLARPAGGDQIFLMHYSKSQRVWNGPFAVTNAGEDAMRSAVAVDGQGRAWVFYSTQRSGNFDIYARSSRADGTMTSEIRLTTDPGTDIFPAAVTDTAGRVWVTWQGFRNNNFEILASAQTGDTFSAEAIVSASRASDWEPAIAAAANGEVAISWDTYDKGDYDVYVRRVRFGGNQISLDDPIAIAASLNFEARSTLAYDPQNRLWIAYEVSGPKWGKDWGLYDTTGIALYQNHTIEVRCLIGTDVYTTTDDVARVLPGAPAESVFQPSTPGPFAAQPDPTIAVKRKAGQEVGPAAAPKNSFPRLATDSEGTVYLSFREPAGSGLSTSDATNASVGSIWTGAMVYFDGAQWHGPGVLANADAVSDNHPAILPLAPGHLLLGQSTDHRLSPAPGGTPANDSTQSDVYALEFSVTRTQQSPQLQKIGLVTPDAPDSSVAAELGSVTVNQSYRPTVNGQQMQLLRGDFHRHSEISFDGARDGPLIDSYRYFIDAALLDWVGCCDHDDGSGREYSWWMIQKYTDAFALAGKFMPMYYYERSLAYPEGHRNIVFAKRGIRPLPHLPTVAPDSAPTPAPDTNMLYAYLHFFDGLSAPHTGATDQGTDWRNNDPAVEPFVEIYQGARQDYEMPGAPRANTAADSISGFESAGYISNALGKGYQLGFEASSDHVSTHISFTNLWVTAPTRAAILDAMKKRRMYGSTDNILADFRSGSHYMGESFNVSGAPIFTVRLWGTAPFQNVVLVKDGTAVYSTSGDRVIAFTYQDQTAVKGKSSYYYVRGLQTDGQIVWVSPMWVTSQ
jgi:hypothetical protein